MTTQWNETFFNNMYLEMFMTRSQEQINIENQIITFFTHAKEKQSIADFCCGTGVIADSFTQQNLDSYGIEFAQNYVDIGKSLYPQSAIFQGDALHFNFNKKFDIVYNWFSSFGYFNDQQNYLLLHNMIKHLKPNGTILIELYNSYHIINNFNKVFVYHKHYSGQDYTIIRESSINTRERLLEQKWIFKNITTDTVVHTFFTNTKLYFADDIINMLNNVGFKNCHAYERPETNINLSHKEVCLDSKRIIITGIK